MSSLPPDPLVPLAARAYDGSESSRAPFPAPLHGVRTSVPRDRRRAAAAHARRVAERARELGLLTEAADLGKWAHLRRPSEVVPELDAGPISDAGLDAQGKERHRRRVLATALKVAHLDHYGKPTQIPAWQRSVQGLNKYTTFLQAPKEDLEVRPPRVSPLELSRAHRGSLLAVVKPGGRGWKKTWNRKRQRRQRLIRKQAVGKVGQAQYVTTIAGEPLEEVPSTDCDRSVYADFDHWCTSSADGSGARSGALAKDAATDGSGSESDAPGEGIEDRLTRHDRDAKSKAPSLFENLVANFKNNAVRLFQAPAAGPQAKEEPTMASLAPGEVEGPDGLTAPDRENSEDSEKVELTPFEEAKFDARQFCRTGKRSRMIRDSALAHDERVSQRRRGDDSESRKQAMGMFEEHTKRFGSRMLEKMGFKGRLGARENGIAEPVQVRRNAGRFGLGARPPDALPNDGAGRNLDPLDGEILDVNMAVVGQDDSGLPSSFTGRPTPRSASFPTHAESGRHGVVGDAYGARRAKKSNFNSVLQEEDEKPEDILNIPLQGDVQELDEDDDVETEKEEDEFENGRRAILLDFDVLICGSFARRKAAFKDVVARSPELTGDLDVLHIERGRDACDVDCISHLLARNGIKMTDAICDDFLRRVDEAYKQLPVPVAATKLLSKLKEISQSVHLGVMHRGSRSRLNRELDQLGLSHSFLQGARMTVQHGDQWPYLQSWQELLCRVGVGARQAMFLIGDYGDGCPILSGVVAGQVFGGRTVTRIETRTDSAPIEHGSGWFGSDLACPESVLVNDMCFRNFLGIRVPRPARRRVMALYGADGLWYAGREEFRADADAECSGKNTLVWYYKYENREWVRRDEVMALPRRDFKRIRDADFPGILEPEDVSDL